MPHVVFVVDIVVVVVVVDVDVGVVVIKRTHLKASFLDGSWWRTIFSRGYLVVDVIVVVVSIHPLSSLAWCGRKTKTIELWGAVASLARS
jgi:hypothetical protein